MRTFLILGLLAISVASQEAVGQEQKAPDRPFVVEQTYWVKPGKERQFVSLYRRTELPRLQREKQAGRVLWIRLSEPLLFSKNEQWDLRVTVAWGSSADALTFADRNSAEASQGGNQRESIEETLRRDLVENHEETLVLEQSQ
jgi:hypothetical protein